MKIVENQLTLAKNLRYCILIYSMLMELIDRGLMDE